MSYGSIDSVEIRWLLGQLTAKVRLLPASAYQRHLARAQHVAPHAEDAPYLALALHLHVPLWSNDVALAQQDAVRVYSTTELLAILSD